MTPAAQPGDLLSDRYRIVKMIGRGAMADVFEAEDPVDDREVAIKILRANIARDRESVMRFEHEAHTQQRIDHRNVARLFGHGIHAGKPFLVIELLRGRSLLNVLRKHGAVPPLQAASYAWQALEGLAATHAAGVLHRDLKPANLMLEPSPGPVERVVLIDFGFAALGANTGLTALGHVVGSLSYLAPERLQGDQADERADLYGVGVILYELLAGHPPFAGGDMELIQHHIHDAPAPLPHVPPAIQRVLTRALAKAPADRYQTAHDMATALDAAING